MNESSVSQALISAICDAYGLSSSLSKALACSGGLLHRTYYFATQQGRFVYKILNPQIIPLAAERYRVTETIAQAFQDKVSLVCALTQNSDVLFYFENDVVMVFPYVEAQTVNVDQITKEQVRKIGHALAQMHGTNLDLLDAPKIDQCLEFNFINRDMRESWNDIAALLDHSANIIKKITEMNLRNAIVLEKNLVISHRDLDPKNVLWDTQAHYYIIDWESAGLINKTKDTIATGVYWSLDENFKVDLLKLRVFLQAYLAAGGKINTLEAEAGLYGLFGDWLGWLDFNLSRIHNYPMNSDEYKLGYAEAKKTLTALPIVFEQSELIINRIQESSRI